MSTVSVIIAAYDEVTVIMQKLNNTRARDYLLCIQKRGAPINGPAIYLEAGYNGAAPGRQDGLARCGSSRLSIWAAGPTLRQARGVLSSHWRFRVESPGSTTNFRACDREWGRIPSKLVSQGGMRRQMGTPRRERELISRLLTATAGILYLTSCLPTWLQTEGAEKQIPTSPQTSSTLHLPVILKTVTMSRARGYLTSPQELAFITENANQGVEPYRSAVSNVLTWADRSWDYSLEAEVRCPDSETPTWIDNTGGVPILYAKALAYHLTGEGRYAEEAKNTLQRIMTEVKTISLGDNQCQLNFGWGTPELVAAADLIEDYWQDQTCTGPTSTLYTDTTIGTGKCKAFFQNWLVKNPYFVVSYSAAISQSNWGAAATTTTAYIADYLWDRPQARLIHRNPRQVNHGEEVALTPAEAYAHANQLALNRMNGYGVEYGSAHSCDYLSGPQQNSAWAPVKSQITEKGILPEDARRDEYCNIQQYNGAYQNYPQVHLGHNIQQCELMLRRGDRSCFDNMDNTDIPEYTFLDPDGMPRTTHLYPGRGSLERAIKAILVDSETQWRHDSALEVAHRYYYTHRTLPGFEKWFDHLDRPARCDQDICFGTLTHGFGLEENPEPPPVVPPP